VNWDYRGDRRRITEGSFKGDAEILLFDEIHKYRLWKTYLKGFYDKSGSRYRILVTGSARLDIYRRGGDSMMGRYFYHRLHPFSVAEFLNRINDITPMKELPVVAEKPENSEA